MEFCLTVCSAQQHVNVINASADVYITNQWQLEMFSECIQCMKQLGDSCVIVINSPNCLPPNGDMLRSSVFLLCARPEGAVRQMGVIM